MIRKNLISLSLCTTLGTLGMVGLAAPADTTPFAAPSLAPAGNKVSEFLFGLEVAGVYINRYRVANGPEIQGITTFHADGTLNSIDQNDNDPNASDSMTSATWRRVGATQISLLQLSQSYDNTGKLARLLRVKVVADMTGDLKQAKYKGTIDVFLPSQDPSDPNTKPVAVLPLTGTIKRFS